jgi:hypothetical protein
MTGVPEVLTWPSGDRGDDPVEDGSSVDRSVDRSADGWGGSWVDLDALTAGGPPTDPTDPNQPSRRRVGRVPRAVLWVVGAAAVGGLVLAAVHDPGGPVKPAPSAATPDGGAPAFSVPPLPQPLALPDQVTLAALSSDPLHSSVRAGGAKGECPIPSRHAPDPVRTAAQVVRAALPGFRLLDSGQTRDRFGGVCLVQLRANNSDGAVLVLNVVPPGVWPGGDNQEVVSLQSRQRGSQLTRTVSDLTATGWRVDVGAVGESSVVPDLGRLGSLADNGRLEW